MRESINETVYRISATEKLHEVNVVCCYVYCSLHGLNEHHTKAGRKERGRETGRQEGWQACKQEGRETGRLVGRQAERQVDRQAGRQV
jgi:hypothetical protein